MPSTLANSKHFDTKMARCLPLFVRGQFLNHVLEIGVELCKLLFLAVENRNELTRYYARCAESVGDVVIQFVDVVANIIAFKFVDVYDSYAQWFVNLNQRAEQVKSI
jgi:hypothetical protein